MASKQGKPIALTKHINAYVDEIPRAWDAYLTEKDKGTPREKAERVGMRSVYPGDQNIGVRLSTWKRHKFWAESAREEIRETWQNFRALVSRGVEHDRAESEAVMTVLKDYPHASEALEIWKRCGVWSENFVHRTEESTSKTIVYDIPRSSKEYLGISQGSPKQTREEIIGQLRALLSEIDIEERKWFGKATGKAPEEDKFLAIGAKLPPDLVLKFKSLPGRYAHHLEKALKLYLMVLASAEK